MTNDPVFPIDAARLLILTTQPTKWLAVIRQGEKADTVLAYVNGWPTYPLGDEGVFLVCIPESQAWVADRLASGLFYAKVHDTFGEAELDAVHQSWTLIRREDA